METAWFVIVALATATYAATDGFDLGIGILFPRLGRNDVERATVRATISHLWRAYEVWLIVLGALLFLAFPRLYAVSFSGFYLAFMILLWCLIGRGLSLEVRSHLGSPVWRAACDILFPIASFLIAFALGAAAGNVVRGVPLDARGQLFLPLWTNLSLQAGPAIFDWYTLITGALAVGVFALHGANYVALKTTDELHRRARRIALWSALPTVALGVVSFLLAPQINPPLLANYQAHPGLYLIVALTAGALVATVLSAALGHDLAAFGASGLLIVGAIAAVAVALYPNLLPGTPDPAYSLTIHNASASPYALKVALIWFVIGLTLIGIYTLVTHRPFVGRVHAGSEEY
ncbi:MAG: cytochrome d ubiquinol oxidase subunit II [Planctomycetes bacterium]|nr:cytochrome d ubiquinol oxidase subunit II [Planctomycetota bacterium]